MAAKVPAWMAFLILALLLVVPFLLMGLTGPAPSFASASQTYRSLGQITAIFGFILFALQFVLAARFRLVEQLLSGLNKVYTYHHLLGGVALALLMVHPLFLALQYLSFSSAAVFEFLKPNPDEPGKLLGNIALNLLVFLLILTYVRRLKYETWKKTHQWLGIPFILGFIHLLWVPGMLVQNQPLKIYLVIIGSLGTFAYLYQVLFKPLFGKKVMATVTAIKPINPTVTEVILQPDAPFQYQAGQFIFIRFNSQKVKPETHPFSLSSNPKNRLISLGIKALGDFTGTIRQLKTGERAIIDGPYGHFTQNHLNYPLQLWLAGGIGITPFIGFLRSFRNQKPKHLHQVHLFYTVSHAKEAAFLPELNRAAKNLPWFFLTLHDTSKDGRLTFAHLAQSNPHVNEHHLLICGPVPMIKAIKTQAKAAGIPATNIHTEEFKLA
jgi:predicted ferric reductase